MTRSTVAVSLAAILMAFCVTPALLAQQKAVSPAALDYEFFKANIQPIFLAKRPGHARCYVCHSNNNARFHLVTLSEGATAWNEQQSRQNFQLIQRVAVPGVVDSPIVMHPLDEKAGGHAHHGGGQQFESQSDPAWQALKAFVMGEKVASR